MPNLDTSFIEFRRNSAFNFKVYNLQASGTYGLMPYRLPPNQASFANLMSPLSRGSAQRRFPHDLAAGLLPRNFRLPSGGYPPSIFPSVPNLQYPLTYRGGLTDQVNLSNSPLSFQRPPLSPNVVHSPGVRTNSGSQAEG